MQLRRIEIRDFRKIGRREILNLVDGLNVVVGDNEAGKSTVLAALRAAFFERHRVSGVVAESMQPYGGTLRPTIAVDFEIDGRPWSLMKAFCQRPEASLQGPGERHVGDAVEDRLADLFGFTPPGRGASKPDEHHGTHGLLWVEQGVRPNLGVGAGRETLAAALEREVGQVTGGERGRALLAAAAERREKFWDKRDKARGPLAEARRHVEELEGEQVVLLGRRREDEARLSRLEALGVLLDRHRRDDHLNRAVAAVGTANRLVQEAARCGAAHDTAVAARRTAETQVADARERRDRRAALIDRREKTRIDAEKAATAADEARLLGQQRAAAARDSEMALDAARMAQDRAEEQLQLFEAALQRQDAETTLADLRAKLAAAEEQTARRHDALARADLVRIEAETVTALTALERAADRARAELAAASVQVAFEPDGMRRISLDGADHPSSAPLGLTRDATLVLEGFGRVRLRPGGGTAVLARKADDAERAFRAALTQAGAETLSQARQMLQARRDAQSEAVSIGKALAVLAPKGIDALRQAVGAVQARLSQMAPQLAAVANAETLAEARRAKEASRIAVQAAEAAAKAATAAYQGAATEAATLIERRDATLRLVEALGDELATARRAADDDLLALRLKAAEESLARAQAAEFTAAAAYAAADVEAAQLGLERSERAEREIRRDLEALEAEQRDLRVALRALGQDSVGERLAALEGELDTARARLAGLEREAAASRLLHDTLLAAQRESKERWLGPVRERVAPYLRLIHPDSEIRMDDQTLEIEGLYRDGILEQFGALSMGAREQVAVVTRLALADILRAAGHPAAVILDDALVNTDDVRLDRMRNVLTRAARNLQILIFTCRERDFLGLGATHRI